MILHLVQDMLNTPLQNNVRVSMKKLHSILLLLFVLSSLSLAETDGGLAGAFARLGAGARAKALGNAYTGLAQGPSAIYFNPGALPFAQKYEFSATTAHMAMDRSLAYLAFTAPLHPKAGPARQMVNAGVGIGWLHGGVGDIDSRGFDGEPQPTIDQSSNLFLFAFGLQFHERFGAGVTAKVIYETFGKIGNDNKSIHGSGFGADLGAFARPMDHLTVGAQLKNLGAKTTWNTTDYWTQGSSKADNWPSQYRLGAAYEYKGVTGVVDLDGSVAERTDSWTSLSDRLGHGQKRLHAGLEGAMDITEKQSAAGRIGYDDGAPTFGIGLGFGVWKLRSTLDLTYVLENIAPNNSTQLSWGVQF